VEKQHHLAGPAAQELFLVEVAQEKAPVAQDLERNFSPAALAPAETYRQVDKELDKLV
jgi:hypothetical protein